MNDQLTEIFNATIGKTLGITKEEATVSNGMSDSMATRLQDLENKDDTAVLEFLNSIEANG